MTNSNQTPIELSDADLVEDSYLPLRVDPAPTPFVLPVDRIARLLRPLAAPIGLAVLVALFCWTGGYIRVGHSELCSGPVHSCQQLSAGQLPGAR